MNHSLSQTGLGANAARPAASRVVAPVIMSGGAGVRLWPLSTEDRPKPFHALAGRGTLLQDAVLRTMGDAAIEFRPPIVICSRRHEGLVLSQLRAVGCEPAAVVLEPVGRSTAAAAVLAARLVERLFPGAAVLLAPADHVIADPPALRAAIGRGLGVAGDRIVPVGVAPPGPEASVQTVASAVLARSGV